MTARPSMLRRRSTHELLITGLYRRNGNGAVTYLDTATAFATLYDPAGAPVAGATNLQITHVNGTTGADTAYTGIMPKTVTLGSGNYTVRTTATDELGNVLEFNVTKAPVDGGASAS